MKNAAKAFALSWVLALAAIGYNGGFSPARTLWPTNGTSAGYGLTGDGDGDGVGRALDTTDPEPGVDDPAADGDADLSGAPDPPHPDSNNAIATTPDRRHPA